MGLVRRHVRPATELPTNHGTVPRSVRHGHEGPSRHGFGYQRLQLVVFAASHTAVRTVVFLVIERSTARRNDPLQDGSQPARARTSPDPGCSSSQHADWAVRARRLQFLGCANSGTHAKIVNLYTS